MSEKRTHTRARTHAQGHSLIHTHGKEKERERESRRDGMTPVKKAVVSSVWDRRDLPKIYQELKCVFCGLSLVRWTEKKENLKGEITS